MPTKINLTKEQTKEMIRLDYLLQEPIRDMPIEFETISRETLKEEYNALLKQDEWVQTYMPHLLKLPPRQRYRLTYMDGYHYKVWNTLDTEEELLPLEKVQKVLFDYSTAQPKWQLIHEE